MSKQKIVMSVLPCSRSRTRYRAAHSTYDAPAFRAFLPCVRDPISGWRRLVGLGPEIEYDRNISVDGYGLRHRERNRSSVRLRDLKLLPDVRFVIVRSWVHRPRSAPISFLDSIN